MHTSSSLVTLRMYTVLVHDMWRQKCVLVISAASIMKNNALKNGSLIYFTYYLIGLHLLCASLYLQDKAAHHYAQKTCDLTFNT